MKRIKTHKNVTDVITDTEKIPKSMTPIRVEDLRPSLWREVREVNSSPETRDPTE